MTIVLQMLQKIKMYQIQSFQDNIKESMAKSFYFLIEKTIYPLHFFSLSSACLAIQD